MNDDEGEEAEKSEGMFADICWWYLSVDREQDIDRLLLTETWF